MQVVNALIKAGKDFDLTYNTRRWSWGGDSPYGKQKGAGFL